MKLGLRVKSILHTTLALRATSALRAKLTPCATLTMRVKLILRVRLALRVKLTLRDMLATLGTPRQGASELKQTVSCCDLLPVCSVARKRTCKAAVKEGPAGEVCNSMSSVQARAASGPCWRPWGAQLQPL